MCTHLVAFGASRRLAAPLGAVTRDVSLRAALVASLRLPLSFGAFTAWISSVRIHARVTQAAGETY